MVEIVMIINADIKAVEKEMAEVVSQKLFRELENVILLKTVDRLWSRWSGPRSRSGYFLRISNVKYVVVRQQKPIQ